jgi:hypothetical protein
MSFLITSCGSSSSSHTANDYTAFATPQLVTINGYSGEAMEPFVSRNGNYLFFNNAGGDKDLFFATFTNGTTFQYQGAITAINSVAVDGVPTMDDSNRFYYVSLAKYNGTTNKNTLYVGTWGSNTVTGSVPLSGLTLDPPLLFFDIEANPEGTTLYLSVGAFPSGATFPVAADIAIAVGSASSFSLAGNWENIMANVNTPDKLEYAPAVSRNGLELFFTRLDPTTSQARIYRAVRTDTSYPFGLPQLVSAITGFVEGPTLSPDEKGLYYHRQNPSSGRFELFRVTRP